MSLTVAVDPSLDELEASLLVLEIENLPMCRHTPAEVLYEDLPDGLLVRASLQVPGTYDEFPQMIKEIALRRGFDPDQVEAKVHPDPDGFE